MDGAVRYCFRRNMQVAGLKVENAPCHKKERMHQLLPHPEQRGRATACLETRCFCCKDCWKPTAASSMYSRSFQLRCLAARVKSSQPHGSGRHEDDPGRGQAMPDNEAPHTAPWQDNVWTSQAGGLWMGRSIHPPVFGMQIRMTVNPTARIPSWLQQSSGLGSIRRGQHDAQPNCGASVVVIIGCSTCVAMPCRSLSLQVAQIPRRPAKWASCSRTWA